MKTLITRSTLVITLAIVISSYIFASATFLSITDEAEMHTINCSVNDLSLDYEKAIKISYSFEEEDYIVDIPFNTNSISAEYNYLSAVNEDFEIEDESYIDDIPFSTKETVQLLNN